MAIFSFSHTLGSAIRIKHELKRFGRVIEAAVTGIFVALYVYLIVKSINHPLFLSLYIAMLALSLAEAWVIVWSWFRDVFGGKKRLFTIFRYARHVLKGATLILAVIEIATMEKTGLQIFLVALSGLFFLVGLIAEFVLGYVDRTINRLLVSLDLDRESGMLNKRLYGAMNLDEIEIADLEELKEEVVEDKNRYIIEHHGKKEEAAAKELEKSLGEYRKKALVLLGKPRKLHRLEASLSSLSTSLPARSPFLAIPDLKEYVGAYLSNDSRTEEDVATWIVCFYLHLRASAPIHEDSLPLVEEPLLLLLEAKKASLASFFGKKWRM